MLDRAASFAKITVSKAKYPEVNTLVELVCQSSSSHQSGFCPLDLVAWMLTQDQTIMPAERIFLTQLCSMITVPGIVCRPRLPGLNVRPFQIEQRQPAQDVLTPFEVQIIGGAQHILEVLRMSLLRLGALGVSQPAVGEQAG